MELSKSLKPFLRLPFRSKLPLMHRSSPSFAAVRHASSQQQPPFERSSSNAASDNAIASSADVAPVERQAASATQSQANTTATTPNLSSLISNLRGDRRYPGSSRMGMAAAMGDEGAVRDPNDKNAPLRDFPQEPQPWHLHVYSHKHNLHLTLTRPNRKAVISVSTGNIGFRKGQRGTYDAGYQLGAYVMARIARAGLLPEIHELELVFRGFGRGREAIQKIILGSEGAALRPKVTRVSDATRLKFGGTRSRKPRRLG